MQKIYFVICKSGVDFMFFKKIFLFKFNIYIKSVVTGFLIFILILFVNFCSQCAKIRNKTFRLHVIANSDSLEDQNLKLKIRDLIITNFKLKKFESLEETKKFAIQNLPEIKKIAQDEIFKNGFNYPVYVKICKDSFNTRTYENISLPAGEYDALKIIIGDGKVGGVSCFLRCVFQQLKIAILIKIFMIIIFPRTKKIFLKTKKIIK